MDGKKLIIGAQAPGSTTFDIAAVLKAALGANIQIVAGYPGATAIVAAMEKNEVEGICLSFAGILLEAGDRLQSANPSVNYFVLMGPEPRQHPLSRGVPVAESLAKTEDAKQMIRAVGAAPTFLNSLTLGPSVPSDRVAALRQAFDRMVLNPEFKADIEKTQRQLGAKNWQQVTQIVQGVLNTSPEVLARLKEIMK